MHELHEWMYKKSKRQDKQLVYSLTERLIYKYKGVWVKQASVHFGLFLVLQRFAHNSPPVIHNHSEFNPPHHMC